jgi:uncharacterized protein YaaQ
MFFFVLSQGDYVTTLLLFVQQTCEAVSVVVAVAVVAAAADAAVAVPVAVAVAAVVVRRTTASACA